MAPPLQPVPKHFVITVRGVTDRVWQREHIAKGVGHLFSYMLQGHGWTPESMAEYGLVVDVEDDMDQGDD